jgi:hypothetical protein
MVVLPHSSRSMVSIRVSASSASGAGPPSMPEWVRSTSPIDDGETAGASCQAIAYAARKDRTCAAARLRRGSWKSSCDSRRFQAGKSSRPEEH